MTTLDQMLGEDAMHLLAQILELRSAVVKKQVGW
jgi:hypothetical protein